MESKIEKVNKLIEQEKLWELSQYYFDDDHEFRDSVINGMKVVYEKNYKALWDEFKDMAEFSLRNQDIDLIDSNQVLHANYMVDLLGFLAWEVCNGLVVEDFDDNYLTLEIRISEYLRYRGIKKPIHFEFTYKLNKKKH